MPPTEDRAHNPASVFWGDIALDEEDLKLFQIDKTQDWIKQSVEKTGHRTGKSCVVALP
ncbi:Tolloid-like protein 2 [Myotis brandtii]|uniref:Tolloid-like protein 2 n=1 Tax=Myotis brandtii TaxID=109478 RepID=S7NR53_MYOBR|nr:Tolloid-like protein 2 [Myotis brandtii]